MKKIVVIMLIAVLCIALCSCAEPVVTKVGSIECDASEYNLNTELGNLKPQNSGTTFLSVEIVASEDDIQPDEFTAVFFGDNKCKASSANGTYECIAMAFGSDDNGKTIGMPVFEIPAPVKGEKPVEYTISGSGFDTFVISVSANN